MILYAALAGALAELGMAMLVLGLVLFVGVHSLSIVSYSARDALAARMGPGAFRGVYSLIALAGLVLVVVGYGAARQAPTVVYVTPYWVRYVTAVLLLPLFVLLAAAYLPGRIQSATKHPMLVAVKLWALAHLLVNGTLADIVLFGVLLAWAVADRISLKRRPPRSTVQAPGSAYNDAIAAGAGLAVYVLFILGAHEWLFGVPIVALGA